MQTVVVKVEIDRGKGFQLFAENIPLEFEDDVGTFPMPKTKNVNHALETQHPEIWAAIPLHVAFCITRQERHNL